MKKLEEIILSDAELKGNIENKLNRSLSISSNHNQNYHFDRLSTLDTLFDHLKPLIHCQIPLTDELIKKISHLLIDSFMLWYRSLTFYSLLSDDLNQFILNNRWSTYIFFAICHFLTNNSSHRNFLCYNQCLSRLREYEGKNFLPVIIHEIFGELRNFLIQLNNFHLTNTEFSLLSILLVIRHGKKKRDIYFFYLIFLFL